MATLGEIFTVKADSPSGETAPVVSPVVEKQEAAVPATAPVKEETPKVEAPKVETKPASEASPKKEEPAKPEEVKPAVEVKKEEKPAPNWEDESNPYLKRHRDTAAWANRTHQENLTLAKHVRDLENEQRRAAGLEPVEEPQVDPEQAIAVGEQVGKARSSLAAAYDNLGKVKVDAELDEFNVTFEHNAIIQARVLNSPQPVAEALRVLKEFRFTQKYGNDTDKIVTNLRAEWETEELPKLREKVTKEIMERVKKEKGEGKGIGDVRDAGKGNEKAGYKSPTLASIFGH